MKRITITFEESDRVAREIGASLKSFHGNYNLHADLDEDPDVFVSKDVNETGRGWSNQHVCRGKNVEVSVG